jgi:methionine-rich copper-binding protein CopC
MIDNDGSYAYSKTVQIANAFSGKGQLVAYPNPLQLGKALQLQYNHTEVAQAATLSLFDAQGKLVQRKNIQLAKGNNLFETNTSQLSSGVYHVQLQVGNKTHQTSVTIGQ